MSVIVVPGEPRTVAFHAGAEPVARAAMGSRVQFEASDASYAELTGSMIDSGQVNFQKVNALCGPLHVNGAMPGDTLGFRIEQIELGRRAFAVYVGHWRSRMFGMMESSVIEVPIVDGAAWLPSGGSIAVEPMVGCIGVAPATGSVSSLSPTARTGGNMDLVEIRPGTTVWLPVETPGALLSMGDLHARMGRGEPFGSGLECAGSVTGRVILTHGYAMRGPILCDDRRVMFVGSSPDHWQEAELVAVRAAWEWLTATCGTATNDALVICAALLDINTGGPAGNNAVASFSIAELARAGVSTTVWPIGFPIGSERETAERMD